jgi:ribonuclease D
MFEDTPLVVVTEPRALLEMAEALRGAPAIGVDTEGDSFFSYTEKVCLVQISDGKTDYVVDPLAVRDLSPLAPIMADRRTVKVFHGADYDVVCLKRDFGFDIRGLFDTMLASQLVGFARVGLADLIDRTFGIELDKKFQRHDWSLRPLHDEHLEYARGDSHWLPALRDILTLSLDRVGRRRHLDEECKLLEERTWLGRTFDPEGWSDLKGAGELSDDRKRVLRALYIYRDQAARDLDRPTFKVIPDSDLVDIAMRLPRDRDALDKSLPGREGMKRRHGAGLVEAVLSGLADDRPFPKRHRAEPARGAPGRLKGKAVDRVYEALKTWRNELGKRDPNLPAIAIAANGTLREIARIRPTTLEELAQVDGVRQWQVEDHGEALLAVLDRVAPFTNGS